VPLRAALSGGGYRDTTRIAESDPGLWSGILTANQERALAALDALTGELGALREAIAAGDRDAIERAWAAGRELRRAVGRVRWGDQAWSPDSAPAPVWPRLLELGRSGRAVRRLHEADDGGLEFEVAEPAGGQDSAVETSGSSR
jgi:hypothetical protein